MLFRSKVKYIICDINDKKQLKKKITSNFNYIVNLGGYVNHQNKRETYRSHHLGLKNLTNFFKEEDVQNNNRRGRRRKSDQGV